MSDDHEPALQLPDVEPTGEARAVDLRDYVDFSTAAARRVRVFVTAGLAVDLWCVEPQQATAVLRYEREDVAYTVLGGRSWMVTEQGEIGLDPMGSLLVPAGVTHAIDNRGVDPLIVVAASSPPGDEGEDPPVSEQRAAVRHEEPTAGPVRQLLARVLGVVGGAEPPQAASTHGAGGRRRGRPSKQADPRP